MIRLLKLYEIETFAIFNWKISSHSISLVHNKNEKRIRTSERGEWVSKNVLRCLSIACTQTWLTSAWLDFL
jgi:hypothetical protein